MKYGGARCCGHPKMEIPVGNLSHNPISNSRLFVFRLSKRSFHQQISFKQAILLHLKIESELKIYRENATMLLIISRRKLVRTNNLFLKVDSKLYGCHIFQIRAYNLYAHGETVQRKTNRCYCSWEIGYQGQRVPWDHHFPIIHCLFVELHHSTFKRGVVVRVGGDGCYRAKHNVNFIEIIIPLLPYERTYCIQENPIAVLHGHCPALHPDILIFHFKGIVRFLPDFVGFHKAGARKFQCISKFAA